MAPGIEGPTLRSRVTQVILTAEKWVFSFAFGTFARVTGMSSQNVLHAI